MKDFELNKECKSLASEIWQETDGDIDSAMELADQYADGHESVIYYSKAIQLCANCNIDAGEEFLAETGLPETVTFGSIACIIAFGEMHSRICGFIQELADGEENA